MATTTEQDDVDVQDEEDQKKRQPIGKPIYGPQQSDAQKALSQPIGKPMAPPQPSVSDTNILPGVDTGGVPAAMPPPEMPQSDTISGKGSLMPPTTPIPSVPMTPKPQYHGLKRVLDTVAGATKIGSAVEAAGGLGTEGWRQQNADEEKQVQEGEQQRQAEATEEKTQAETGEAASRGKAAEAAAGSTVVTINGVQYTVPQKDAEKLIGTGITQAGATSRNTATNDTRENVANTNAAAKTTNTRHTIKVMGDGTYEEMTPGAWTKVGEAPPRTEPGNYVPINDENGATTGWVNPKNHTVIKASEIPGMTGEGGAAPSGSIPPKPPPAVAAANKSAQDSFNYATDYLASGKFTGTGDEALVEQFFNLARPSTGFRMSQPQINMLRDSRSWIDSAEGEAYHAANGTWFPPDQRKQIVDTMLALGQSKGVGAVKSNKGEASNAGAGGTSQSAPHKVGDTVTLKSGKTVKIIKVHPDNSFDAN